MGKNLVARDQEKKLAKIFRNSVAISKARHSKNKKQLRRMTPEDLALAVTFLQGAFRSEDPMAYVDGDGEGWGPALGAAAAHAAIHNGELRALIKILKNEIKKILEEKAKAGPKDSDLL